MLVAHHAVQGDHVEGLRRPSIAYRPNIIIRATQKNRMSYPVTSTLVG